MPVILQPGIGQDGQRDGSVKKVVLGAARRAGCFAKEEGNLVINGKLYEKLNKSDRLDSFGIEE
ncbi:uncharacterized protein G2W53_009099 [Senna tora]|uniref:Uncharacterized protein n=1 Tax=Senna tora TaxID=362788 RepID=A0A835C9H7_9FABA|nr:uncharacterized protein G2W53_009099 [Senna tora]